MRGIRMFVRLGVAGGAMALGAALWMVAPTTASAVPTGPWGHGGTAAVASPATSAAASVALAGGDSQVSFDRLSAPIFDASGAGACTGSSNDCGGSGGTGSAGAGAGAHTTGCQGGLPSGGCTTTGGTNICTSPISTGGGCGNTRGPGGNGTGGGGGGGCTLCGPAVVPVTPPPVVPPGGGGGGSNPPPGSGPGATPPPVVPAGPTPIPATPPGPPLPFTGAGKGLARVGELGGLLTLIGAAALLVDRRLARLLGRNPQV